MADKDVEIKGIEPLYRGFMTANRYHLRHRLFDGGWSEVMTRELVERSEVAAVLPYDVVLDKVVLIEQFRVGAMVDERQRPWLMEIVAGIQESGESLADLAIRETREEAGLVVKQLMPMYRYWVSPGMTNERVQMFCASVDASEAGGVHGLDAEHEDIRVHVCSAAEAFEWVESGRVCNAIGIMALQWLQLNYDRVRAVFGC